MTVPAGFIVMTKTNQRTNHLMTILVIITSLLTRQLHENKKDVFNVHRVAYLYSKHRTLKKELLDLAYIVKPKS